MSDHVVVPTDEFTTALKAAKVTAFTGKSEDPTLGAVMIHSSRRASFEAAGEVDVLVFTSYNGSSVGQYVVEVTGLLDHPVLLDTGDFPAINSAVKTAQKKQRKAHGDEAVLEVRLSLGKSPAGSEILRVQTTTDGAVGENDMTYDPVLNDQIEMYPLEDAMYFLTGVPEKEIRNHSGEVLPEGEALVVSAEQSKVMNGIQGVFKDDNVFCYPLGHSANRRILTCNRWRGGVPGATYSANDDLNTPENDVLAPPSPEGAAPDDDPKLRRTGERELTAASAHIETLD